MASPSVTYTFVNSTTADASQVNQNFSDLIAGLTDGSKDLNISALTCAGTATLNGNSVIGNAAGDTVTVNGTFTGTGGAVIPGTSPGLVPAAGLTGNTGGSAIAAGYIGEQLSATQATNIAINTSSPVDVVTVTLTTGVWSVSAQLYWDNAATQTGVTVNLKVKGVAGASLGVDQIVHEGGAGTAGHVTFATRMIVIATGDANKNVALNCLSRTASGNARGAIYAIRCA